MRAGGRTEEIDRLLHLASSGTYALLEAPRRLGKTSLLNALIEQWARRKRSLALRVDFSEVLTAGEVAARIERAYAAAGHRQLARLLRAASDRVVPKLGPVQIGPPRRVDRTGRVHDLLELPLEVVRSSRHRALVAFDEFQDVLAVPGLDGVIRSQVQHHHEHVTYVFSGSEPSLLRDCSPNARPLYSQALPVRLGRIERSTLAEHIQHKFTATGKNAGAAASLCAGTDAGHPQRTVLLAWHVWERSTPGASADADTACLAIDDALKHRQPELEAT